MSSEVASLAPKQLPQVSTDQTRRGVKGAHPAVALALSRGPLLRWRQADPWRKVQLAHFDADGGTPFRCLSGMLRAKQGGTT